MHTIGLTAEEWTIWAVGLLIAAGPAWLALALQWRSRGRVQAVEESVAGLQKSTASIADHLKPERSALLGAKAVGRTGHYRLVVYNNGPGAATITKLRVAEPATHAPVAITQDFEGIDLGAGEDLGCPMKVPGGAWPVELSVSWIDKTGDHERICTLTQP